MLIREVVARHLPDGGTVRVLADPVVAEDLWLVAQQVTVGSDPGVGAAELVLVDAGDGGDLGSNMPGPELGSLAVLLLTAPLLALPVGRLAALGRAADLHFVEAVPLRSGRYTCAIVAAREARPLRAHLTGAEPDGSAEDAGARRDWEWGLAGLLTPASELAWEQERASLCGQLESLEAECDQARAESAQAKAELSALQRSVALQLGRDLVSLRRHPLRGMRALVRDGLAARRKPRP